MCSWTRTRPNLEDGRSHPDAFRSWGGCFFTHLSYTTIVYVEFGSIVALIASTGVGFYPNYMKTGLNLSYRCVFVFGLLTHILT